MKQAQGRCVEWLTQSCLDVFDDLACASAMAFCQEELLTPTLNSGELNIITNQGCMQ
jgi:hypothetical protein